MNRRIFISFLGLAAILFAACAKDEADIIDSQNDIKMVYLPVEFGVETDGDADPYAGSQTRAPQTVDESGVADVWLFQFDGLLNESKLIVRPQFISGAALTQPVAFAETSGASRLVAVANIGTENFGWNMKVGVSTFADLKVAHKAIYVDEDTYPNNHIMMSGEWQGPVSGGTNISLLLKRSLAKVVLNLSNTSSDLTIKYAQMCNVPSKLDVMAGLFNYSGADYPSHDAEYIDLAQTEQTIAPSGSGTFVWYLPRNEKGVVNSNTDSKTKNTVAPANATYIRVVALDASNEVVAFKFYPGANMVSDFNLKPNSRYDIDVTIASAGDPAVDSRIENYTTIDLADHSANSYILNPPPAGIDATRKYRIYPKQVSLYWGGNGYENLATAQIGSNADGNAKRWNVRVIWMDAAGMVTDVAGDGNISLTAQAGAAGDDNYFELEVPATAIRGNFTVGVFREEGIPNGVQDTNEPFLWSWHFWVTDYNPEVKVSPTAGRYVYGVNGGAVHRYEGAYWQSGGIYENAVMMDRYLGTLTAEPVVVKAGLRGYLYYQYGRKDPMPSAITLYDTDGGETAYSASTNKMAGGPNSSVDIQAVIANPTTFVTESTGSKDWSNETETAAALLLWKDKNISGTKAQLTFETRKSIFDPCPYGWQLPNAGTWDDFVGGTTTHNPDRGLDWTINSINAVRYWPGTGSVTGSISYPAIGRIMASTGDYNMVNGVQIPMYTSTPENPDKGHIFYGHSAGVGSNSYVRSYAAPVRCIKVSVM